LGGWAAGGSDAWLASAGGDSRLVSTLACAVACSRVPTHVAADCPV